MVTETNFDPLFDYSSVFKYDTIPPLTRPLNYNNYRSAFTYQSLNIDVDSNDDKSSEESWLSSIARNAITILLFFLVILSFPLSVWICVKKIHGLERIVLMRLGKLQPVRGPGFTFVLPVIDTWRRVDLRPKIYTVPTSQLLTADRGIIEVQSDVEYKISDVTHYVLRLSQQEKTLKDLGLLCLHNIVSEKDQEDFENQRELIGSILKNELNRSFLKWGIEILNVYIHPVKVLKAAEPVDALGTIMIALKAATGHSSEHTTAVFPVISETVGQQKSSTKNCDSTLQNSGDLTDALKKAIFVAESKGVLKDVTANFKFDIVGNETKTVYCSFKKGIASIEENPNCEPQCDLSLVVTDDNMKDFLSGKISPLEAYMDGRVKVIGDWNLLRPLAKILEEPINF